METSETAESLKRGLFRELYELDVSDDSVNDVGTVLAAFRAAKPAPKAPQAFNRRRANHAPRQLQPLGRTVSAPTGLKTTATTPKLLTTQSLSDGGDQQSEAVASPASRSAVVEDLQSTSKTIADQKPIQMAPSAKGKRKRGRLLEVLPGAQQIFRGLRFCKRSIPFMFIILILQRFSTQ